MELHEYGKYSFRVYYCDENRARLVPNLSSARSTLWFHNINFESIHKIQHQLILHEEIGKEMPVVLQMYKLNMNL